MRKKCDPMKSRARVKKMNARQWQRQRNEKRISNYLVLSLVLCYLCLSVVALFPFLFSFTFRMTTCSLRGFRSFSNCTFFSFFQHGVCFLVVLLLSVSVAVVFVFAVVAFTLVEFIAFSGSLCVMAFSLQMVILTLFVESSLLLRYWWELYVCVSAGDKEDTRVHEMNEEASSTECQIRQKIDGRTRLR